MHFELESAQKHSAEVANGLLANAINNALPKAGIKKPPTRWLFSVRELAELNLKSRPRTGRHLYP
ncbi:hypothetical protein AE445_004883 [Salmonella enterica subsp. enterica serovar Idikan]|uniref:Uncharacterized protein n=1 Tax=Salmonella thompson TaxID=600 RepID=A0A608MWP7_SALTH|nr:hypothetical protein [Salmonella enterica subsp. enterica]ECV1469052.1 hypothetical protein [Salmonella enterica subsp. enterica serovar Thompson]EDW0705913.1 hypothetical protein [Salmonella enterica subsp. enterica]EEA8604186.1 hypothetical protein [Salmonella enterica subsp. enterica serovar Lexington]EGI5516626.1 hypothetical protein [Salmonella enterica subsp. enterica serovar Idikan]